MPQVVSIGPLHRNSPELKGREEYKMKFLKAFLDRTAMTVKSCLKLIRGWEKRVRSCYAENITLSSDEFAKMILVDSCFIIESILRYCLDEVEQGVYEFVRLDMMLVENQLPFFVLDGIFHLAFTHNPLNNTKKFSSFVEFSIIYLEDLMLTRNPLKGLPVSSEVKHFVDLLRLLHLPSARSKTPRGRVEYVRVQSATELQEAGMKIKIGSNKSFLEMTDNISTGMLEIPLICVTDCTESLLRNLIALEVHLYKLNSYIIDCVFFMDGLIDTAKDVDILVQNGVMVNYVGESQAVANMFNNLTTQVWLNSDKYYFCTISRNINLYCKVPHHKWKATLKRDYFSTPIKVASVVAATVLLVLTFIQTVCSVVALSEKDSYIAAIAIAGPVAAIAIAIMVVIFYSVR